MLYYFVIDCYFMYFRQRGLKLLMDPCPLEEVRAMLGPAAVPTANFAYTVFGGSALMAYLLNINPVGGDASVYEVVKGELCEYLADSEYAARGDLILQAARVITAQITHPAATDGLNDAAQARAVQQSLFAHTYTYERDAWGGTVTTGFASKFVGILAGVLVERAELNILRHLRRMLTSGGVGFVYKAERTRHSTKTLSEWWEDNPAIQAAKRQRSEGQSGSQQSGVKS